MIEVTREFVVDPEESQHTSFVDGQSYSVSFKLVDDGQHFSRYDHLQNQTNFPLATNFFISSLGQGSVSLATTSLREVTELQLQAQREYFLRGNNNSNKNEKFSEIVNQLRQKYPMGSLAWKQQVKFVKQNGPWYENYCLARMLDFMERNKHFHSDDEKNKNNTYNITVIAVTKTETNVPESFDDFLKVEGFGSVDKNVLKYFYNAYAGK